MTENAIRTFRKNEPELDAEFILIDNNSEKKLSAETINSLGVNYIANTENLGFAKACNQGIMTGSEAEYILLLNSDVLIKGGTIAKMINFLDRNKELGISGPKFLYPNGDYQISAGFFPNFWRIFFSLATLYKIFPFGHYLNKGKVFKKNVNSIQEVDWLSGGCLLIKKEVIDKIGLLDENYFFGFEDMDYCLRAKNAGYKIIYYPEAEVIHYHGLSSGGRKAIKRIVMEKEGIDYFYKKNYPKKLISRFLIKFLYSLKIFIYKFFLNSRPRSGRGQALRGNDKKIKDATIAITYRCNSRCRMCNIWQIENPVDLPLAYFNNLSPDLKYINLTGGEPFLRSDLPEIVKIIKRKSPRAKIIISTNGLATDLIIGQIKKILAINNKVGIRISLDGLGEMHNQVRGIPDIFSKAMATIDGLKKIGVKNLGISFTIMDFNVSELKKVYDFAQEKKLQLAMALVQNSDIYFTKDDNTASEIAEIEEALIYVISNELTGFNIKKWFRAYYDYGLLYFAKHKKRLLASGAGLDSCFIDPDGNIYPSNLINIKMGNLGAGKLAEIWNNENAENARQEIKNKNITESWIICTIRGVMKKNILKIGWWIIRNKFKMQIF